MRIDPQIHHRRSIRLKAYDYSLAGAYFVTVCVENQECLLGEVVDSDVWLSEPGGVVQDEWDRLPIRFPTIELDAFQIVPNRISGILVITDSCTPITAPVGALLAAPKTAQEGRTSLFRVMRAFKSITAIACNRILNQSGVSFWQRGYHEHIIRNQRELEEIRAYIANNPAKWQEDHENPNHHEQGPS